jgi:4-amino-4-deoxy-L-arabinose transferase-like glycosyltransferase
MIDWLARGGCRLPLLLGLYFLIHVLVRTATSTSLDYDESEQVVLAQSLLLGYNSQPPLYTWIQRGLFELFGVSVFPLALLKNLFIWLTYLCVFESIRKATSDLRLAAIATLGLLSIPQIAWESHRDLSHTVAATFATALLAYAVISLAKESRSERRIWWYLLVGFAVGLGALFKYNFAIVVAGFAVAALSVPAYRVLLLDRRILISIVVAATMVVPHVFWMVQHSDLVSEKTITTLTDGESPKWLENVATGFLAMGSSLVACCGMAVALFFLLFVRKGEAEERDVPIDCDATRLLLQRFFLAVLAVLLIIVLTGHAVEFKNRWFQPFICLLPAYLVLAFAPSVLSRRRAMNVSAAMTAATLLVILAAVVVRPVSKSYRGKYSWLNIPYGQACDVIQAGNDSDPQIIVAQNMRVAGNLKVEFPAATVISPDSPYLAHEIWDDHGIAPGNVLVITDHEKKWRFYALIAFAEEVIARHPCKQRVTGEVTAQYLYGREGDTHRFRYAELEFAPIDNRVDAIADSSRRRHR